MVNRTLRVRCKIKILFAFALVLSVSMQSFAQSSQNGNAGQQKAHAGGPRKQLGTIIFAGLGGAILGLSTLSFYGRPQEKLNNIGIGLAVGIIAGTSYVTYKAATNPSEFYSVRPSSETDSLALGRANMGAETQQSPPLSFSYAFTF